VTSVTPKCGVTGGGVPDQEMSVHAYGNEISP
jgi:hypothetical protein